MSKILKNLKKYFQETSKEQLERDKKDVEF